MIEVLIHMFLFPGVVSSFFIGFVYMGIVRKLSARMQHRVGPPLWQPFLDWIKLMSKESTVPKTASEFLFTLSPIIAFASMLSVLVFLPIGSGHVTFEGNLLVVIYLLMISSLAFVFAGFSSGSPFGFVGSIREIVQMFGYEFPFILSLLTVGLQTGFTLKPYFALGFPFATLGFILSLQGKLGLPPFHVPDAEQEIVAGPLVEYSGFRLGMFELVHAVRFWVLISLGAVMFFGSNGLLWFFINSFILLVIIVLLKVVFARIRIDHVFKFYWFVVGPLVVVDFLRSLLGIV